MFNKTEGRQNPFSKARQLTSVDASDDVAIIPEPSLPDFSSFMEIDL
jgi:hypothetical protein